MAEHIKVVSGANKQRTGSGFTVWSSSGYLPDGFHSYCGPPRKEFDSSWATAKEANMRARYLFHACNPYGIEIDELQDYGIEESLKGVSCLL